MAVGGEDVPHVESSGWTKAVKDNWTAQLMDVVFNGRRAPGMPAEPPKPVTITLAQLIERKSSTIRYGTKYYRIVVTEVEKPKP